MAGGWASDGRKRGGDPPESDPSLDAELSRAVPSGEAIALVMVFVGGRPKRVHVLSRPISVVGRVDADVPIVDPSVAERHALILYDGHGFEIEDLGSATGSFIGGQRITRAPLRNGDRVTVGRVEFIFLLDHLDAQPTDHLALPPQLPPQLDPSGPSEETLPAPERDLAPLVPSITPPVRRDRPGWRDGSISRPISRHPPEPRGARPAARDDEDGPSLIEIVGRVLGAYRFIRRRAALIISLATGGAMLGLATIFLVPPRWGASCDVKLVPQVKANPVGGSHAPDEESLQFFQGAEGAFTQPELVSSTLRNLDGLPRTEAQVLTVVGGLKLEPLGEHLFHAAYKDRLFGGVHLPPLKFLTAHVQNYVRSEIDKSLREFNARAEFLRGQMKSVEKDLSAISGDLTTFREANSDRLPEDAAQTHTSRFQLESRRADLVAQVRRLEGELGAERGQLNAGRPLSQTKFQSSGVYRDSLAEVNRKLTQAYALGLADGHPDIQRLNEEKRRIQGLINSEMQSATGDVERDANPAYQSVQNRVDALDAQLRAARSDLADTEKTLGQIRGVVGELPRVEQRIVELTHMQEATTHLHGQLFEKLMQAELQVNLERVSAESRYEITTPRLEPPRSGVVVLLRGGLGLMGGLLLAAGFIVAAEGKRLVMEALGTEERRAAISRGSPRGAA